MIRTITSNETTYTAHTFEIKNTTYEVIVVQGKSNYVNVNKKCKYRRTFGKDFANFDVAAKNYKNPQIKIELLKIELGL